MQDGEFSTTSMTKASPADVNNNQAETNVIVSELSDEALLKMEVIQNLLEDSDAFGNASRERTTYTIAPPTSSRKTWQVGTHSQTSGWQVGTGGQGLVSTKSTRR